MDESWKIYEPLPQTVKESEVWKKFVPAWEAWKKDHKKYLEMTRQWQSSKSDVLHTQMTEQAITINGESFGKAEDLLNELIAINREVAQEAIRGGDATASRSTYVLVISLLMGLALAMAFGLIISNGISRPVQKGLSFAQRIAEGDFRERLDIHQQDEIGMLGRALNTAADDLEKLISEILVAAQNLSQAVQEISSGNENLSQRTSEQASSLEEIASTIEEATASINQNTDNSVQANGMAEGASRMAVEGGNVVGDAVNSIIEVNQSSKKISEIITVINEIAFQTNLLALNAAVEAARAGEQGRGFAVVAGEVRNLAQRSGNAAKEINTLINDSVDKVGKATEQASKSGEALREIINAVQNVSTLISEIAAASEEQKNGINQINVAVSEMDNMTQQNSALVEETASASEEMAGQAQAMMEMMSRFKIRDAIRSTAYDSKHKELHLASAGSALKGHKPLIDKNRGNGHDHSELKKGESDISASMSAQGFEEF